MYTQSIPHLSPGQFYVIDQIELKSALHELNQLLSYGIYGVVANLSSDSFQRRDSWIVISLFRLFKEYLLSWMGQVHYYQANQDRLQDIQILADRKWSLIRNALIHIQFANLDRQALLKQNLRIVQAWQKQMESKDSCLIHLTGHHFSWNWKLCHSFPKDSIQWLTTLSLESSHKQQKTSVSLLYPEIREKCADAAQKRQEKSNFS